MAYERTSHSSNIKALKYYAAWRLLFLVDFDTEISFKDLESI